MRVLLILIAAFALMERPAKDGLRAVREARADALRSLTIRPESVGTRPVIM